MERKKILLTGTFDTLHSGHINLFYRASLIGDVFVGVTSDRLNDLNVEKEKLIFDENERMEMIRKIIFIKGVYLIDAEKGHTPESLVRDGLINSLAYGSDYIDDTYKEKFAEESGIELLFFDRTEGISSTQIRKKLIKIN